MSAEGFGCLYLPSIAPQSANLNALGTQDSATLGGIGSGIISSSLSIDVAVDVLTERCVELRYWTY